MCEPNPNHKRTHNKNEVLDCDQMCAGAVAHSPAPQSWRPAVPGRRSPRQRRAPVAPHRCVPAPHRQWQSPAGGRSASARPGRNDAVGHRWSTGWDKPKSALMKYLPTSQLSLCSSIPRKRNDFPQPDHRKPSLTCAPVPLPSASTPTSVAPPCCCCCGCVCRRLHSTRSVQAGARCFSLVS